VKWKYVVIAMAAIFFVALALFPNIVYDRFIWKYFVGPIIADATGHPVEYHGVRVREGYTIVSEIVYGITLVIFIYLLYLFFEKFDIKIDFKFILASLPFILYGSVARVLEDAGTFGKPLSYLFISPLIYAQIGILFMLSLFYGIRFHDKKTFIYSLILKNIIYIATYYLILIKYCIYTLHPLFFALLSIITFAIYNKFQKKDYIASLFSFGFLLLATSSLILAHFSIDKGDMDARILIAPLAAFLITLLIYLLAKYATHSLFTEKLNLLLIFSHMLDGMTTYFAVVDPFHFGIKYGEKHPLPDYLMKNFYGIGYPLLKLFVILGIIYVIDDLNPRLKNTIKFFILFLGLSPGLRDLLRILIGV